MKPFPSTTIVLSTAVILGAVPLVAGSDVLLRVCSLFFLQVVLLSGLFVVTGLTRVISLCHAALAGVGAYWSALLAIHFGIWPIVTIPIASLTAAVVALLLSQITRQLADHYLTLATLAASEILTNIFRSATALTGGPNGVTDVPPVLVAGDLISQPRQSYLLCVLIGTGVVGLISWLDQSQVGRALRAVGDEGLRVESLGVSQTRLRALGFAVGAAIAGMAGAVSGHVDGFVGPESFGVSHSVRMLCFLYVVGLRNRWGVVIAAALISFAHEFLREFLHWQMIIVACLSLIMLYSRSIGVPGWVGPVFQRRFVRIVREDA
jgi:branched-chain amino acid transport system permease protein